MYHFTDSSQYAINAAQNYMQNPHMDQLHITPDNKLSEGIDSVHSHQPAPWLPVVRFDDEFKTHVVISSQRPVAHATHTDGTSYLVPAGFALMLEANDTTLKYTKEDVKAGIKNAQGNPVTDGEAVMTSVKAAGVLISPFCGIANYNILRNPGGDGTNPNDFIYRNYNPQPGVSYNMDYAYEFPMVKDAETLSTAPLTGIAAFVGKKAVPGQFITYDKDSNYVLTSENDFEYGTVKPQRVIGQVSKVTRFLDPDSNKPTTNTFNHLVHTVNPAHLATNQTGLNALPGLNNQGLITKITYANGYGLISFSLQTR